MKKLNTAKSFLRVGLILNIVLIVLMALMALTGMIMTIAGGVVLAEADEEVGAVLLSVGVEFLILGFTFALLSVAGLILNNIAINKVKTATCKKDYVTAGIFSIICGVIFTTFPIVSGILLLTTNPDKIGQ